MPLEPKNKIEKTLKALKEDFVVVDKTRIRSWHAWLILGVVVGVAAGVFFVANEEGKFEVSRAELVCDDFGCYDDTEYWDTYDPGVGFFDEDDFYGDFFGDFDFNDFSAYDELDFDFEYGIWPQDFDIAEEIIREALDGFNTQVFNEFYTKEGEDALDVSENLLINLNNTDIDDLSEWLNDNVDARLSAVGVPENQIGLIDNAQMLASPEDFPDADDETIEVIGFDPNSHLFDADDVISITDETFSQTLENSNLNLNQDFFPGHPNVSLVTGELDSSLVSQWKNDLSEAYENATPAMQSLAEQNSIMLLNQDEFNLIAEVFYGIPNQSDVSPAFQLGDTDSGPDWPNGPNGTSVICADCALTEFQLSQRPWATQDTFPEAVFIHELTHLAFNDLVDQEATDIFSEAHDMFEGASCAGPHACDNPTELFATAVEAYTITRGSYSPVLPFSPAYDNWLRQIDWLLRHGLIKPSALIAKSSFNLFNRVYAQSSASSYRDISNMFFGQGMFRLPDVGAINSAADTALTLVGGYAPPYSKFGASEDVIAQSVYLIRDISQIALKISEFGVDQAKKYAASGKDVSAQDQAAGAASILVALDDYARFSKEAEGAIRAYANAPGSKDVLDENPRFLTTTFVSAAQLKQKSPSSAEVKNADSKARMFFKAAQYLSADLSAIAAMISYHAATEQYLNIQTVVAAVYTERAKTLGEDTSTIAGNKTLISSAKTNAATSLKTANAIYASINKIALAKKTPEANAIKASALSELNKIKNVSASITRVASRASTLVKQSTATLNSIKKTVATLPSLMSDLEGYTSFNISNETSFIRRVRVLVSDSIAIADKISGATTETRARELASQAIKDLNNVSKWLDPKTLNNPNSLAYNYWSPISLAQLSSLKKNSVDPVLSVRLPNSFKTIDGYVLSSNADLNTVNKVLADIATSIQMLQNFEVQIKAL